MEGLSSDITTVIVAHGPISYLANEAIQKKEISRLKGHGQLLVAVFSILGGILPDFDLFYTIQKHIPNFMHHDLISHTPIFYLILWIVLRLLLKPAYRLLNKRFAGVLNLELLTVLVNTLIIATLVHLFADLLVTSIVILYPISNTHVYILRDILEPNRYGGYMLSPLFGIEGIIVSLFVYIVYVKFLAFKKPLSYIFKGIMALSIVFFLFSTYMHLQTYNRSYMYDPEGNINYDLDYDVVKDAYDWDIGNTGENNIQKADDIALLNGALEVINSKKLASMDTNSLAYTFGAFDSYRVVSQAYFNIHLPIEPVLRQYDIQKNGFEAYTKEYKYLDILYAYIKEDGIEINMEASVQLPSGRILFFIGEEEEILNVGITLEGNYVAVVMEDDTNLQMHSYDSVLEEYADSLETVLIQR